MFAFPQHGQIACCVILHKKFGFNIQTPDLNVIYLCDTSIARGKMNSCPGQIILLAYKSAGFTALSGHIVPQRARRRGTGGFALREADTTLRPLLRGRARVVVIFFSAVVIFSTLEISFSMRRRESVEA
jgi:hypothetical protein